MVSAPGAGLSETMRNQNSFGSGVGSGAGSGSGAGGGTYAQGSNAGSGHSGWGGSDSNGMGVGGGAHGHTVSEISRDPAAAGGSANGHGGPIGTQDPENYFSMLNPNDNLFKIVERRYTKKSEQWSLADALSVRDQAVRKK